MSVLPFEQLPDSARLWIYAAERRLTENEITALNKHMTDFMAQWTAHKRELITGWQLKYEQFVMVAVDEAALPASGCSIDSIVHSLADFGQRIGLSIVDTHSKVFYRTDDGYVMSLERLDFKRLVRDGGAGENTRVFDNTLQTLGQLRRGEWERPMKESWHWQAFAA